MSTKDPLFFFYEEALRLDTSLPAGVRVLQNMLISELVELGFSAQTIANAETESADFIWAERPGRPGPFITLVGHADTVLPPFTDGLEHFEGRTKARASGAIDNKGGLLVALYGLKLHLKRRPKSVLNLRVLSSPNEEQGSVGFISTYHEAAKDTGFALGFEPSLDDGSIIDSRRGNRWYDVHIQGRSAHAGRSQGEHVNAGFEMAKKLMRLEELNDLKRGLSVNVAAITGGTARHNVICGEVNFQLDLRFADFKEQKRLVKEVEAILNKCHTFSKGKLHRAVTTFKVVDDCPPFATSIHAKHHVKTYLKIVSAIEGRAVKAKRAGGAGDVNHMSREGMIVLDGLGPSGGRMHTTDEFVEIKSLRTRAEALAGFLDALSDDA